MEWRNAELKREFVNKYGTDIFSRLMEEEKKSTALVATGKKEEERKEKIFNEIKDLFNKL